MFGNSQKHRSEFARRSAVVGGSPFLGFGCVALTLWLAPKGIHAKTERGALLKRSFQVRQ